MQEPINPKTTIEAGLTSSTQEVFETVSKMECIKNLLLCGGTGISIQLNHRLSEDLDFAKLSAFQEEFKTFRENPLVDSFLAAELDFCRMMQSVNFRLVESVDFG